MSDPFVSAEDFVQFMGMAVPDDLARLQSHIDAASAMIRRYCDQELSQVTDDVVTLAGVERPTLILPQRPVTAITSVAESGVTLAASEYTFTRSGLLRRANGVNWSKGATVTYSHGYAEGSDEYKAIAAICMAVAARAFTLNKINAAGSVGSSEAYGELLVESRGYAPEVFLSKGEEQTLADFGKVWVG